MLCAAYGELLPTEVAATVVMQPTLGRTLSGLRYCCRAPTDAARHYNEREDNMTPRLLILITACAPMVFGQALTITTPNALPVATINQAYSAQLTAMGGESSLLLAFSSRGESFGALYGFRFGAPERDTDFS